MNWKTVLDAVLMVFIVANIFTAAYQRNWNALGGWLVAGIGWAKVIALQS